jgi:alpha-mannosidase
VHSTILRKALEVIFFGPSVNVPIHNQKKERIDSWSSIQEESPRSSSGLPIAFRYIFQGNRIPPIDADEQLILRNWFGGESLVRINGIPMRDQYTSQRARSFRFCRRSGPLEADVVPKGLFGSSIKEPVFSESDLLIVDSDIKRL